MKNRGVLLSLTIAGLFCWILMFLLNASSRDPGGISYLLSVAGAALFIRHRREHEPVEENEV